MDTLYFLFVIPGFVLSLLIQAFLKLTYSKYSSKKIYGISGIEIAETINLKENCNVKIKRVAGHLSDHYNPISETVAVSESNSGKASIASVAVIAHEFGHVLQKRKGMALFNLRNYLVPAVNFSSRGSTFLFFLGIVFTIPEFLNLGIILFGLTVLFSLITLPLEIDASLRGLAIIKKYNLLKSDEIPGARQVLIAAALTYFAVLVQQLLTLGYYVIKSRLGRSSED